MGEQKGTYGNKEEQKGTDIELVRQEMRYWFVIFLLIPWLNQVVTTNASDNYKVNYHLLIDTLSKKKQLISKDTLCQCSEKAQLLSMEGKYDTG